MEEEEEGKGEQSRMPGLITITTIVLCIPIIHAWIMEKDDDELRGGEQSFLPDLGTAVSCILYRSHC